MCNFGTKDRTCSLSIQINEKAYNVKGTHIDDHGDSHAKDGFCNAVRVAKVSGKVKKITLSQRPSYFKKTKNFINYYKITLYIFIALALICGCEIKLFQRPKRFQNNY